MALKAMAVVEAAAIAPGDIVAVDVGGVRVAVANVDGTFYAFDDTCTHEECSLAEGVLEGMAVTCPCHGAQFHVKTGRVLAPPAPAPVKTYPVRRENGRVIVEV